ncbi:MAG: hypothetical protein ACO3GP_06285, partial [Candidatus Limnocylindrus sp.]
RRRPLRRLHQTPRRRLVGPEMKTPNQKLKDYCDSIIADEFCKTSDEEQNDISNAFFSIVLGDGKWLSEINENLLEL